MIIEGHFPVLAMQERYCVLDIPWTFCNPAEEAIASDKVCNVASSWLAAVPRREREREIDRCLP